MNTNAPIGTEDNMMAPWNQIDNQEIDRDCVITETISRKVFPRRIILKKRIWWTHLIQIGLMSIPVRSIQR